MLSEARRISKKLDAELLLIHAGEKNPRLEQQLKRLLERVEIDPSTIEVIWEEGKPVQVLSEVCYRESVDLLILGAVQNEAMLNYYIGTVARRISRRPPCSLLLVTNPKATESRLNSLVVNGIDHPKTENTIRTAMSFAAHFDVNEVTVVEEVSPAKLKTKIVDDKTFEKAQAERERLREEENQRIREVVNHCQEKRDIEINMRCVFGKEGYSIGHFAEVKKADLLVMNSPDSKLGFLDRFFPHDLEYVLSDMPCDLMIVHPN